MRHFLSIAAFVLAALLLPAGARAQTPPSAPETWAGDWHGTLTTARGDLRLVLTIRRGADGVLGGELESIDQAPGQKIPVPTIAIADGRLTFEIPAIHATYEGTWQPADQRFTGTFVQGTRLPLDLARGAGAAQPVIAGLDGIWNGSVSRGGVDLRLIVRITTGTHGTIASFDAPDMLASGLPVAGLARDGRNVSFTVTASNATFHGTLAPSGNAMSGTWTRPGAPDQQISFTRRQGAAAAPGVPARPQTPHPPFPYRSEEVHFANPSATGVTLAGTLTLPPGPGPFPAAIMITGSGGQDRDETLFAHKPFAVIADYLTRRGIAVLRYDDRGVAASTGRQEGATSADFATDANAAFAFLKARPEIDGHAIGFIGHSEGGMIGPLAAVDNPETAWLVLLAGPGTKIADLMTAQRRAVAEAQGATPAEIDQSEAVQRDLFALAAGGLGDAEARAAMGARLAAAGFPEAQRQALVERLADTWFRWFARYDPAPVLARIRVPVLALNGSLDRQVVAGPNLAGIRAALAQDRDVTIVELPGLNHLFQTAHTGGVGEYAEIEETMAPRALETIATWIKARFPGRATPAH